MERTASRRRRIITAIEDRMVATSIRLPVTIIRGPTATLTVTVMTSSRYGRTATTENPTIMQSTGGRWAKIRRRKRTRSQRRTRKSRSGDCVNNILDRFIDRLLHSQWRCQDATEIRRFFSLYVDRYRIIRWRCKSLFCVD